MQRTLTYLLFVGDKCGMAEEAIKFYTSLFAKSKIKKVEYFKAEETGGKEGQVKYAIFTIDGLEYMAADSSLEHNFTFTPSMSIYVNCKNEEEIDSLYQTISKGGKTMMPLDNYGFGKKFCWIADKYGVSWQLNLPK